MRIVFAVIVYCAYAAFCWRVVFHALLWHRAAAAMERGAASPHRGSLKAWVDTAADVVLFRRLFHENGLLWISAWTFHVTFLLVLVRHLRYFINSVPPCIVDFQSLGLLAGYLLPASILLILLIRSAGRERYVSRLNYFILGLVLLIGITGFLLHIYRTDLTGVKEFVLGILTFSPHPVPHSLLFIVHFLLVLLLLLSLPFHIFIAPVVMHEARRREVELREVLHEK